MKILFLCHRFPFPPNRGGKIRPFHMIKYLANEHEVFVCTLARSAAEAEEGQELRRHCAQVEFARVSEPWQTLRMIARLPTQTPSSMGFFYSGQLATRIQELQRQHRFDCIIVHCSSVAQYVSGVRNAAKLLDFGDMDSQKWLEYSGYKSFPVSLGYWWEGKKLELEERRLAQRFDLCTTTTRFELATLNELAPSAGSDWFPNGVDHEFFRPSGEEYDRDLISFVGRMDYYPNQECMLRFCADVLPRIQAQRPNARLLIIGADPSPAVVKLGHRQGVTVTGSVPDVRDFVRRSAIMAAPLAIARGTQNKILEAMAMGVPVVTSTIAANGVDAIKNEHLLVSDGAEDCAQSILKIMGDLGYRRQLASAALARVKSHHDWGSAMSRFSRILQQTVLNFQNRQDPGMARRVA